ncbi:MAG: ATP-binding protein [Planctomycetota bacterium]|jgi:serine/threonine-protein kinase RsbW
MTKVDPDNEEAFEVCVIDSDLRAASTPKQAILRKLEECQYGVEATFAVKLAIEEALSNAVKHGNLQDQSKQITVRYAINTDRAVIIIRDEGMGFEPESVPDCRQPERLPIPNGRGIMLIRAYMDEVEFRDEGREIRCVKYRR